MFALIIRQAVGLVVVASPLWGTGLLCAWLIRDRKTIQGSKTSGSMTALAAATGSH